jgi:6-phosphogluconolactonase (cycloisomerase 2 family)
VTITTAQIPVDPRPRYIAVDPSGLYAYVSHQSGDVSTWNIDPGSFALSFASTVVVQTFPTWIALDPNGQFAYTVVTGGMARLTIGSGGALSVRETTTTGTGGSFFRTATIVSVIQ